MDRREIHEKVTFFCEDELQYAIARDDKIDTDAVRERATMRLCRLVGEKEIYELARGLVDKVYRRVERGFMVDLSTGQLRIGSAIRTDDNTIVPTERARLRDWLAYDEIKERAFQNHLAAREAEREVTAGIIERLQGHEDATTFEVCPDLFPAVEAA